jgi:hypothetical protein
MRTYKIAVETSEAWVCADILKAVMLTNAPIHSSVEIVNSPGPNDDAFALRDEQKRIVSALNARARQSN